MPFVKAIGQAIFKLMAGELATSAEMIRAAAKLGGTYRRTEMLADIRKYKGFVKHQGAIEALADNRVVPRAWMIETQLKEPGANYRVFGKAQFYDWNTGTEFSKTVSFYHTDLMKKEDYARDFDEYFTGGYQDQDLELLSFNQIGVEHNLGKPYAFNI